MHHVMGVCCIVFDFDGMLFDFFMNFLNIEKNIIFRIFVFNISCFLHVLCYFQHLKKNSGWGGVSEVFFKEKHFISFHVLCYFQH